MAMFLTYEVMVLWRIIKIGNILGVVEIFPHWVAENAKTIDFIS
jgi:hypothetical protein